MGKTAMVRVRTEPALKRKAEEILERLGLTPSAAINLFYAQIVHRRGLPFDVALPRSATRRAIRDARAGRKLIRGRDADDLIARLDEEDG